MVEYSNHQTWLESFTRIYISSWRSILTNVSILTNPLSRIIKSKVFNLKMDEHSSESKFFNYKILYKNIYILMDEYSRIKGF